MADNLILMGVIGRPHGVRGHVHVQSYTARPRDLAGYGRLLDRAGRVFTLRWVGKDIAEVSELDGQEPCRIKDRESAARLTNRELFVERTALPEPDADEFYLADLVGMAVLDETDRNIGTVKSVYDAGGGAMIDIEDEAGKSYLVPFRRASVPEIDVAGRRMVVHAPMEIELHGPVIGREASEP